MSDVPAERHHVMSRRGGLRVADLRGAMRELHGRPARHGVLSVVREVERGARPVSLKVTRLYRTIPVTPDATAKPGISVHMKCSCGIEREFMAHDHLKRRWSDDWADIFAQTRFRCASGWEAYEMRIVRTGRDHTETLLRVTKPLPPGQPSHATPEGAGKPMLAGPPKLKLTPPRAR